MFMAVLAKIMSVEDDKAELRKILIAKPNSFNFISGQSVVVSLNRPGLEEVKQSLVVASPHSDYYLEVLIKESMRRERFNENLFKTKAGEEIILWESTGKSDYNPRGVFVVNGLGIAPALSVIRQLRKDGSLDDLTLIYTGKTNQEFLAERELRHLLGKKGFFLVTRESGAGYETKKFDENFIKDKGIDLSKKFYVFGPETFFNSTKQLLEGLGSKVEGSIVE